MLPVVSASADTTLSPTAIIWPISSVPFRRAFHRRSGRFRAPSSRSCASPPCRLRRHQACARRCRRHRRRPPARRRTPERGLMLSAWPFSVAASSGRTRSTSENQNAIRIKKNICLPLMSWRPRIGPDRSHSRHDHATDDRRPACERCRHLILILSIRFSVCFDAKAKALTGNALFAIQMTDFASLFLDIAGEPLTIERQRKAIPG